MLVDLSHPLSSDTPVYPGDPHVEIEPAGILAQDGFADSKLTFGTHVGTHIDAPAHMVDGGKSLGEYSLDRFILNAACVEGFVMPSESADAVIFYTGASKRFTDESYWHEYDVMSLELVKQLAAAGVKLVGVDTGSVDNADGFPIHKALLENDILIVENLTNLELLVGKTFKLSALPLNVNLDGAPARVVAEVA